MEINKIIIPDGCKAEIRAENGQTVVIVERKGKERWRAGSEVTFYYTAYIDYEKGEPNCRRYMAQDDYQKERVCYESGNYFRTLNQCKSFCDDLNEAIKPIYEKARQGEYDK